MTKYLEPITYKQFKEEVYELGGKIYEKDISLKVIIDDYIFAEIFKYERCRIRTDFGYVSEFDDINTNKLMWLVARLSETPLLDREEAIPYRYKLEMLKGYPDNFINVDLSTNVMWISDSGEWGNAQTAFTDSEVDQFPEDWRQLFSIATKERVDS